MVAGRNFSRNFAADSRESIIINETMVGILGLGAKDEAIGQRIFLNKTDEYTVISVIKDYKYRTLENKIGPMAFVYDPEKFRYANIRYVQAQKEAVNESLAKLWGKIDRIHPLFVLFFDEMQESFHENLDEVIQIATVACAYIIFVALCGLLGMSMYTTELRVKEIGIRKVFGSTVSGAVYILSKDCIKLILYSSAFALPCACIATAMMMRFIAHKPGLSLWVLPLSLLSVLTLALVTISSQTVKAALTNPIDALREE